MRFYHRYLLSAILLSGCVSMQPEQAAVLSESVPVSSSEGQPESVAESTGRTACGSFFVYEMCLRDTLGDRRVDYLFFADTEEIFMYRPGADLPKEMPVHRCAVPMRESVVTHSSTLLYGEDLSLLQEMDVKRKLLLSYMAARDGVDACYGGDSRRGQQAAGPEDDFMGDEFDWGGD